ncbi:RNA-guided pseudouridylation complex pseudouridine synthase subunit Cbf5 [Candidatus Woesearchaeota archaeon]|nr:RNA-guided pseudouridylation complex pseudouridine synthase subunit Cbf5 [Candidatus Woesearchaeota archaeon]
MITKLPFQRIDRQLLTKRKATTTDKYGSPPNKRSVEQLLTLGIVNIDKPKGPTSHQVSAYVKGILNMEKCGHSGTLDPKVTGVLPVALDAGTRVVEVLLSAGKEYICLMHLHQEHPTKDIEDTINSFVGKIKQLPPVKSAIKRQWRYRKIYYIEILEIRGQDVLFKVGCQAGTYIRKLCHDIGVKLGSGAHMSELRRTQAGPFNEKNIHTLQDLADAFHYYKQGNEEPIRNIIMPIEYAVSHLPKLYILDSSVNTICHGASLALPGVAMVESEIQVGEDIAILTLKGELVALGRALMISKEIIQKKSGFALKVYKVFMKPDTYPKMLNL